MPRPAGCGRTWRRASGTELGVLIIDSHGRAWRMGTVGVAIGVAGFPALVDLRGRPDLYGYRLRVTQVGMADEMAAAASALMGQADERRPVVHVRGLPYPLREGSAGRTAPPASGGPVPMTECAPLATRPRGLMAEGG